MAARKLLVASLGIAAVSFGCSSSERTVGNAMGDDCGSCTPDYDTGTHDSGAAADSGDAADSASFDAGDAEADAEVIDTDGDARD